MLFVTYSLCRSTHTCSFATSSSASIAREPCTSEGCFNFRESNWSKLVPEMLLGRVRTCYVVYCVRNNSRFLARNAAQGGLVGFNRRKEFVGRITLRQIVVRKYVLTRAIAVPSVRSMQCGAVEQHAVVAVCTRLWRESWREVAGDFGPKRQSRRESWLKFLAIPTPEMPSIRGIQLIQIIQIM